MGVLRSSHLGKRGFDKEPVILTLYGGGRETFKRARYVASTVASEGALKTPQGGEKLTTISQRCSQWGGGPFPLVPYSPLNDEIKPTVRSGQYLFWLLYYVTQKFRQNRTKQRRVTLLEMYLSFLQGMYFVEEVPLLGVAELLWLKASSLKFEI